MRRPGRAWPRRTRRARGRRRDGAARRPAAPPSRPADLTPRPARSAGSGALRASSAVVCSVQLPGQPHVGGRGRAGGRRRRRLESPCWAATRLAHAAAAGRAASRTLALALPLARWKSPRAAGARPGAPAPAARARLPPSPSAGARPRPLLGTLGPALAAGLSNDGARPGTSGPGPSARARVRLRAPPASRSFRVKKPVRQS